MAYEGNLVRLEGGITSEVADGDNVALGAKADAAASTDTGTFSLIALFKRLLQKVTALALQFPAALDTAGYFKVGSVPVSLAVLGSHTVDTSISAATTLTPESGAKFIVFATTLAGKNARYRVDGGNPTATVGYPLIPGDPPVRIPATYTVKVIEETAGADIQWHSEA